MNRKKIGIVTWFNSENYGTNLQAYALYYKLSALGHNCFFINEFDYKHFTTKGVLLKVLNRLHLLSSIKIFINKSVSKKRYKKSLAFFDKYSKVIYVSSVNDYKKMLSRFDVFVAGSDQIWNPNYFKSFYFLDFADNKKRIAFASSIGVKNLSEDQKKKYLPLISAFNFCGIRENSGAELINSILERNFAKQVVDPTFLLSSDEWVNLSKNSEISIDEDFMFCYFIGQRIEYESQVIDIANKKNIHHIIIVPSIENPNFKITDSTFCVDYYPDAGIEDFLRFIYKSKLVCTDSFHATAISINLKKNFVEFMRFSIKDPKSQNTRIIDILKRYNLENRLYHDDMDIIDIDYSSVFPLLERDIYESTNCLIKALED